MFAFGEKGGEWFWGGVQRDFNFIRMLNSSIKKKKTDLKQIWQNANIYQLHEIGAWVPVILSLHFKIALDFFLNNIFKKQLVKNSI